MWYEPLKLFVTAQKNKTKRLTETTETSFQTPVFEGISVVKYKTRTINHTNILENSKNSKSTVLFLFKSNVHNGHLFFSPFLLLRYVHSLFDCELPLLAEAEELGIMKLFCPWSRRPRTLPSVGLARPLRELTELSNTAPTNPAPGSTGPATTRNLKERPRSFTGRDPLHRLTCSQNCYIRYCEDTFQSH